MLNLNSLKYDGGYGVNGNLSHYILLNSILPEEYSEFFRDELKKDNPEKYEEYLIYEKRLNGG